MGSPVAAAARARLAEAVTDDDPVWRAAMAAPLDTTPETEEERAGVEEARREGRFVPGAEVTAEIARRARDER